MPDNESTKPYHGYVSEYLNRTLRTYLEAEQERQLHAPAATSAASSAQIAQPEQPTYRGPERRAVKRQ